MSKFVFRQRLTPFGKFGMLLLLLGLGFSGAIVGSYISALQSARYANPDSLVAPLAICAIAQFFGLLMIFLGREFYRHKL